MDRTSALPRARTRTIFLVSAVAAGSVMAGGPDVASASSPPAPPDPAKLQVLRAGVKDGRLDVLAAITRRADGDRVRVAFAADGARLKLTARVHGGRIRLDRRLPASRRRTSTGIVELRYEGTDRVRPARVRLRAASNKARLKRDLLSLHDGVITARGSVTARAKGVVRIILSYVRSDGTVGEWQGRARLRRGGWSMQERLPAEARGGGDVSMQFTGYHPRRIRGEQIGKQLLDGQSFGRGGALDPTARPAAQTAPDASALPAPGGQPITTWQPPGSAPLSDAQAAARVRPVGEVLPQNRVANAYRPSAAEIRAFLTGQRDAHGRLPAEYNPALGAVTGSFAGTTDEILQWAAHKWGIPEDLARAVAVTESFWRQDAHGDRRTVPNPLLYPVQSLILGTSDVYESLGLMQIKWRPDGSVGNGTEPLRWKSTAFNADVWGATVRYYYDGACSWCGAAYAAGQEELSIAAWYSPSPWGGSGQHQYVAKVSDHAAGRTWARPGF